MIFFQYRTVWVVRERAHSDRRKSESLLVPQFLGLAQIYGKQVSLQYTDEIALIQTVSLAALLELTYHTIFHLVLSAMN